MLSMKRTAALLVIVGFLAASCGSSGKPDPHDQAVRDLAHDESNVGRLDEAAVRIKLGAPDLRKTTTVSGRRYVEMNYTPPGCSFFFASSTGLLADAECS
jgi:hypothetical protein